MKTDYEIYTAYCKLTYEQWRDALKFEKEIKKTYDFQCYKFKVIFNEFIEALIKQLKFDKILNKFKDK